MGKWISVLVVAAVFAALGFFAAGKLLDRGPAKVKLDDSVVTPGWKRHTVPSAGIQIDLPVEYTALDPKDPKIREAIQAIGRDNPEAEGILLQAIGIAQFVFWAFDLKNIEGGFAKNVNVLHQARGNRIPSPGENIEPIRESIVKDLPPSVRLVDVKALKMPAGNVLATVMQIEINTAVGKSKTWSYGYSVNDGDAQLTVTFTCLEKDADSFQPIAERAMETFRLID